MTKSNVEHLNLRVMISGTHFCRRSARLMRGGRFNGSSFLFRGNEIRIAQRLNQRIASALRLKDPFLGLRQAVQKFSLRDFIFYGCLGLVHSNHQRKFAKADWSGGELADGKEGGGNNQQSIISGVFHNSRFYQTLVAVDNPKMLSYCAASLR